MWLMTLMSNRWYARKYDSEEDLRNDLDDVSFIDKDEGNVVSICVDLESWCDEMGVELADVVPVAGEDDE